VFVGSHVQPDGTVALVEVTLPAIVDGDELVRQGRRWSRLVATIGVIVIVTLAVGNLALLGVTLGARVIIDRPPAATINGVGALRTVDDKVLRGANPTHEGYEGLHASGVTTIVDLRAETYAHKDDAFIESLGLRVVHLPIRDGQTPSDEQQAAFAQIVGESEGPVFLHCGAGVGRTGVVAARYLVETGQLSPLEALARNLEVGPPSLEQDAYSLGIDLGPAHPLLVAASRFFDSPRRILHYL
jgi:protein tyrosine phosphatase (PTP) superfamily phosphohydrolase (DUF442 family)